MYIANKKMNYCIWLVEKEDYDLEIEKDDTYYEAMDEEEEMIYEHLKMAMYLMSMMKILI